MRPAPRLTSRLLAPHAAARGTLRAPGGRERAVKHCLWSTFDRSSASISGNRARRWCSDAWARTGAAAAQPAASWGLLGRAMNALVVALR
jgi:hypothetical protein